MTEIKKKHEQFAASIDLWECEQAAYKVFCAIMQLHGKTEARRIFLKFGCPPSARKIKQIKNELLLLSLDRMKPKPTVQRLARELAKENETLPQNERHGPRGSTNQASMDKHIRLLLKEREASLKKGTWWGPVTDEQAVRYLGARK
jgi:hypothetical protein